MYSLSVGVFRHLIRRRGVRFVKSEFPRREVIDDLDCFEMDENSYLSLADSTRFHVTLTSNYILEEKKKGELDWGKVNDKLIEAGVKNPATKVFQACLRLNTLSTGLSYYDHLLKTGQSLTIMDLLFFSKLLLKNKGELRKYEPLLLKLYDELKDHFFSSALIRKFAIDVFLEIPGCFNEIVFFMKNNQDKVGYSSIIDKALELNRPKIAFEFISDAVCFQPTPEFLSNYVNFCIRRAKEGAFIPDLITELINVFESRVICFNSCNLIGNMKTLVEEMNKIQDEYRWSVSECLVNENKNTCSRCLETLLPKPLTQKDIQTLRDHFYQTIFIKKSVYLTSHKAELKNFYNFLDKCSPFHVVLDVLNLLYKKKQIGAQLAHRALNYFLDRELSVLLISRAHSKAIVQRTVQSLPAKYQRFIQTFFTADISEDDIFLLQAALHGGIGTGFLTSDNCTNHLSLIDDSLKKVFLKWQMTHQYIIDEKLRVRPPLKHSGVPQLTSCIKNKKYIWHLSHQPETIGRLTRIKPVEWLCLKAIKK